jgi:branched-chain amino acid transport system ATP-binding protein
VTDTDGAEPLLKATELVAGYIPEVNILNGANIDLFDGELVGVIGPNGAGKSTLIKALFGLVGVRSGTVTLRGEDVTGAKAHDLVDKGIGYVPQRDNVFPRLTIEENLQIGSYARGKQHNQRFSYVTDMFPRLGERRKQRAGSLSGGEQQMVAIARALIATPKLLLMDEPSLGLAPLVVRDVFRLVRDINAMGISILMVEQNARQALRVASWAYLLEVGAIVDSGPVSEIASHRRIQAIFLGGEA